ncbi:helix-turn-helix domain-containing protein [Nereida sp. MMG025]|uniref:helix-turn-helix domain-containing protein n=1 Tax=Nereida sp. MMG025 TaxID=2909981 RepID=UPI001F1ED6D4|nr:helix-turn-helix domain-containing protein [Nereida sp. MMG025]MCF6443888.1 helix-turn-helix domain-containing protein [Nereida sp. MMG025]
MEDSAKDWFSPEASTFGDRVAGARDAAGMSQEQLAKRLGVKLVTLQNWENDLSEPRANKLTMMAGLLSVSLRWLLEGEGDEIEAPGTDAEAFPEGVDDLLLELRKVRIEMEKQARRAGVIEKRLRAALRA